MMTIMIALAATALSLEEAGRVQPEMPTQGCKPYFRRMSAGVRPARAPCFQMAATSLETNNPVIDAQTH